MNSLILLSICSIFLESTHTADNDSSRMPRPPSKIPDSIPEPFPVVEKSPIISGFGRGSSELGIPTANIPINASLNQLEPGIYFGWSRVIPNENNELKTVKRNDGQSIVFNNGVNLILEEKAVLPVVMSIGYNPFYNNTEKTAELHIVHGFKDNFYGALVAYTILGYIRPELDYTTKGMFRRSSLFSENTNMTEALIEDIKIDIKIALEALKKPEYYQHQSDVKA